MKSGYFIFSCLFLIYLFSCNESQKKERTTENCVPAKEFLLLVKEMERSHWIPDTNRQKKVYRELDCAKLFISGKFPFYCFTYEQTRLYKSFSDGLLHHTLKKREREAMKKVKKVIAYFYRKDSVTLMNSDGVIEQWEFDSENNAEFLMQSFKKWGSELYFNTTPYYHRIRNSIFVLHSRASAFSLDQKVIFEKITNQKVN